MCYQLHPVVLPPCSLCLLTLSHSIPSPSQFPSSFPTPSLPPPFPPSSSTPSLPPVLPAPSVCPSVTPSLPSLPSLSLPPSAPYSLLPLSRAPQVSLETTVSCLSPPGSGYWTRQRRAQTGRNFPAMWPLWR